MVVENDLSADALMELVAVDGEKWNSVPSDETIARAAKAIENRGITVVVVENKQQALAKVKELIPPGAEVSNGSSTTLIEIGFTDYFMAGKHGWKNLKEAIVAETDKVKQSDLSRKSEAADYFLSSVNAIAETGELVACDATGSRVGAFPFAAKNLVLVSGVNKIVPTLQDALARINEFVFPIENERAKKAYGVGSTMGKFVIISREITPGRITLILVRGKLGL